MKLNLGCGRTPWRGYVNVDKVFHEGITDLVLDFEVDKFPYPDNSVDEMQLSHVLEHIKNPLFLMEELYRIAKPESLLIIRVPYGSSDNAFEDPTHVRNYFRGSWYYFTQVAYFNVDYGYHGDWDTKEVKLTLRAEKFSKEIRTDPDKVLHIIDTNRNVVDEMTAELIAIKPMRKPAAGEVSYSLSYRFNDE